MRKFGKLAMTLAVIGLFVLAAPKAVKAEGWVARPEGYYYVYNNGFIATNTTVGIFTVGPTGLITYQEAVEQTNKIIALQQAAATAQTTATAALGATGDFTSLCAQIAGPVASSEKTDIEKIRSLFDYMINATEYKRDYTTPTGNWGPAYAYEALTTGQGNCYRYAAAFAYLLKAAGYDSRIVYGQIHSARGGLTPHSWTEINLNGVWFTCDCEMQDAKKSKYDFFLIPYEQYPIQPLVTQGYLPVNF